MVTAVPAVPAVLAVMRVAVVITDNRILGVTPYRPVAAGRLGCNWVTVEVEEVREELVATQGALLLVVVVVEGLGQQIRGLERLEALRVEEMVERVIMLDPQFHLVTGPQEVTQMLLPQGVVAGRVPEGMQVLLLLPVVVVRVAVEAQLVMREMRVIPAAQLIPQQLTV